MRILIMTDLEGISGIVVWEQTGGESPLFQEARRLYTEEINAAVRGAKAAGATEIVVVDCHGAGGAYTFNSLVPELLDPDCEWVAHHPWSRYTDMLAGGCDACILVGMHARAGTPDGVLCHTVSSTSWRSLAVNGTLIGEVGINAALCGGHGVPIALVTGDVATCREAKELLGDRLPTVAVKTGLSRFSARQIAPVKARQMIEAATKEALLDPTRWATPFVPTSPVTLTIEVGSVDHALRYKGRTGMAIADDNLTITSTGATWDDAWDHFWPWQVG